jgi:hypothetical protein
VDGVESGATGALDTSAGAVGGLVVGEATAVAVISTSYRRFLQSVFKRTRSTVRCHRDIKKPLGIDQRNRPRSTVRLFSEEY